MKVEAHIGNETAELFNSPKYKHIDFVNRGFALPTDVRENALLFIGLNPSYVPGNASAVKGSHFYKLQDKGNYKYYKKFEELSEELGVPWTHFDMLPIRETRQKKVGNLLKNGLGREFLWKNLILSKRVLESSKPRVIVVQNSLARTLLGRDTHNDGTNKWLGYEFEFDKELGTHRIISADSNLQGTPVFFTSMLTGQRALDKGSYERFVWHMNRVLHS